MLAASGNDAEWVAVFVAGVSTLAAVVSTIIAFWSARDARRSKADAADDRAVASAASAAAEKAAISLKAVSDATALSASEAVRSRELAESAAMVAEGHLLSVRSQAAAVQRVAEALEASTPNWSLKWLDHERLRLRREGRWFTETFEVLGHGGTLAVVEGGLRQRESTEFVFPDDTAGGTADPGHLSLVLPDGDPLDEADLVVLPARPGRPLEPAFVEWYIKCTGVGSWRSYVLRNMGTAEAVAPALGAGAGEWGSDPRSRTAPPGILGPGDSHNFFVLPWEKRWSESVNISAHGRGATTVVLPAAVGQEVSVRAEQ